MAFKKFQGLPTKPTEAEPSIRKVCLPPAKLHMVLPTHLWVREFWHKSSPSDRPWIKAYCPKFYLVQKWARPRMLKGQLSTVPWPGNSRMPFTFQPACSSGSSAAPQTFTLTLASYSHRTSTSLHSICFINPSIFFCSFSLLSSRGFLQSTAQPHQSTELALERAASHIKETHPPTLSRLLPQENVNRSNNYLLYVTDVIH